MPHSHLSSALSAAVPLWQYDIANKYQTPGAAIAALLERREELQALVGDEAILYPVKEKGKTAKAFNAVAEAIALMSILPGGVTVFGQKWIFPERLWPGQQTPLEMLVPDDCLCPICHHPWDSPVHNLGCKNKEPS